MSKNKNIPELRFPEFVNEGEWEEKNLDKLAIRIINKNEKGIIKNVFTNSAADGIVNQRDFFDKDIANKSNLEDYFIVEPGDYVYNPRISNLAPVGPLAKNKTNDLGVMSPLYTVFKFIDKNNNFYEYYFQTYHWINNIRKIANTGARFDRISISSSQFMSIEVFSPKSNEQQKIASCLSSLDDLISVHSEKLDLLKVHKKGLMQNLFPQNRLNRDLPDSLDSTDSKTPKLRFPEFVKKSSNQENQKNQGSDNVPAYRFPEFVNDDEWMEKKLGEVCLNIASGKDKNEDNGEFNLYGSTGIIGKTNIASYSGNYILVARVGANAGFLTRTTENFGVTDNTLVISLEISQSVSFIYYLLEDFRLSRLIFGSGQPLITGGQLKSLELSFPSLQEQQKIASCLSSLDEMITAQAEKIEQLKQHKKGLMQGLFPKNV